MDSGGHTNEKLALVRQGGVSSKDEVHYEGVSKRGGHKFVKSRENGDFGDGFEGNSKKKIKKK